MSSRKKTELIERVRYPNPIPLPPYPPKLLEIQTPSTRYTDPRVLGPRLAQNHPLPMVVDAEAGMPLNLTDFPQAWYTDQELEADDEVFPRLDASKTEIDPEDAFLLSDVLEKLPQANGASIVKSDDIGSSSTGDPNSVTWLRRTEYLASEQQKRRRADVVAAERKSNLIIDSSREAQLDRIRESFDMATSPLTSLRHPNKPGVKAVDAYSLLPDFDTWATQYHVFRFGDLAGRTEENKPVLDPRLETGILRPHVDAVHQSIYSLFLVGAQEGGSEEQEEQSIKDGNSDDDMFGSDEEKQPIKKSKIPIIKTAEEIIASQDVENARIARSRLAGFPQDAEEQDVIEQPFDVDESQEPHALFNHIREYETHDETQRKDQELILTFIDDDTQEQFAGKLPPSAAFENRFKKRRREVNDDAINVNGNKDGTSSKVVLFHPVETRASLRVRRRRINDPRPPDHWDVIAMKTRSMSMYEKVERLYERKVIDGELDEDSLPERIELPIEEDEAVEKENNGQDELEEQDLSDLEPVKNVEEQNQETLAREAKNVDEEEEDEEEEEKEEEEEEAKKEEEEGEEGDDNEEDINDENDSQSNSSDDASGEDELDEDELAALQAEAGNDANVAIEDDEEPSGRRRSKRGGATNRDAESSNKSKEILSMDIDEED